MEAVDSLEIDIHCYCPVVCGRKGPLGFSKFRRLISSTTNPKPGKTIPVPAQAHLYTHAKFNGRYIEVPSLENYGW